MFEMKFFDPVPLKCRKESWKKILKGLKSVFILLSNFSCSELLSCSKNLEIQSKLWRDDVWKFNVYLNSEYFCQRRRQVHLMMMMKWRTIFNDLMTIKWRILDHNYSDVHQMRGCGVISTVCLVSYYYVPIVPDSNVSVSSIEHWTVCRHFHYIFFHIPYL